MVKGLIRFALIWAISIVLTPYVNRFFDRLAARLWNGGAGARNWVCAGLVGIIS